MEANPSSGRFSHQEREDAAKRVVEAEVFFATRFEAAMVANKRNPPAAIAQIFSEAGDDPELCGVIVLLHLTYLAQQLGRQISASDGPPDASAVH